MRKILVILTFSFFLGIAVSNAQCAMCKRIAETNQKSGENKAGRGLNKGILYLLSLPYIIGGIGAVAWYKNRKKL